MLTSADFKELLNFFEKHSIRYLVVGGYAVMRYSEPRFTKNLDLLIATDQKKRTFSLHGTEEFGAPLAALSPDDFTQKAYFYPMGRPPLRIDIMMSIPMMSIPESNSKRHGKTAMCSNWTT